MVRADGQLEAGADPGFSERGSEILKKRLWSAAPEARDLYC